MMTIASNDVLAGVAKSGMLAVRPIWSARFQSSEPDGTLPRECARSRRHPVCRAIYPHARAQPRTSERSHGGGIDG